MIPVKFGHYFNVSKANTISRFILPARQPVPPTEGRHQSHQVPEGEGQGCSLQRKDAAEEEEAVIKLYLSEEQSCETAAHFHVHWSSGGLHSNVLHCKLIKIKFLYCSICQKSIIFISMHLMLN